MPDMFDHPWLWLLCYTGIFMAHIVPFWLSIVAIKKLQRNYTRYHWLDGIEGSTACFWFVVYPLLITLFVLVCLDLFPFLYRRYKQPAKTWLIDYLQSWGFKCSK